MSESPVDPEAFNAFEAAGWESKAGGYDQFFGRITDRVIERLLDSAGVGSGTRVLDVATGPGYAAALAAARGASVVGMDFAEEMVSLAIRLHPDIEFRRGDAEALPFPDESFDAVVSNFGLLHLGRPEQAASEFARVLVSGGRVALTVWDLPERTRLLGVFLDAVAAAGATPPEDIPAGPPFFRFSDDREFAGLLTDSGFEDATVSTVSFMQTVTSPDELWHGLLGGTVRTSALILRQPEELQRQIRGEFDRIVQQYVVADHLELPVAVKLASAREP